MFIKITLDTKSYFIIEDTKFQERICDLENIYGVNEEVAIIKAYKKNGYSNLIPNALAKYYNNVLGWCRTIYELKKMLNNLRNILDTKFPELEYGIKYYPCVLNHLKHSAFGSGTCFKFKLES